MGLRERTDPIDPAPMARRPGFGSGRFGIPALLLSIAGVGWWWSARMAADMAGGGMDMTGGMDMNMAPALTLTGFLLAWLAMMAAMMFPAISPVVKLYSRAAAAGRVAPLPFFVAGYIAVWGALGIPAFFAWRTLSEPFAAGRAWTAYLAGGVLIAAAVWQLTPLKAVCLRHCRSPLSVFLLYGARAATPSGAARMGATHGSYCVGCCWALMAVLVAVGTMNLAWMAALAVLILLEKTAPHGERIAVLGSAALLAIGIALVIRPQTLSMIT